MEAELRAIPRLIESLREREIPNGRVLSAFLDISPQRLAGEGYLFAFREACRHLRLLLPEPERTGFEAASAQAERYLVTDFAPVHTGLAMFATGSPEYFYAVPLPSPPEEKVNWGERPVLEPLQETVDEYERVAVLLFDKERARLFTVFLGEIEETRSLEDEVPGKQARGGWFALAETRYARHHEDHVLRHAKRAAALAMDMLRARPFDRLFVAGPQEALSLLEQRLPRPLRARLFGTLNLELFASDAEVQAATLEAAERIERAGELEQVRDLVNSTASPFAEVGQEATLAALADDRVHRLFASDSLQSLGSECASCHWLGSSAPACPRCGAPTVPVSDLRERAVERALDQAAEVEIVSGEASDVLLQRGGLAAWTRY